MEKFTAKEGEQILFALLAAQKRYELDHGSYTSTFSDLDVDFQQPKHFDTIDDDNVQNSNPIADIARLSGGTLYTLEIDDDGTIRCVNGTVSICTKLGY